jgi:trk system potassium uptake protein TrkA
MRIIIVGSGKVGTALIDHLAKEGHSLVVIDSDSEVIENLINKYDIKGVCGNGTSFEIQKEAGVDGADLVIAVTSGDEVNILTCLFAKKAGASHTIARVRTPEYSEQVIRLKDDLGLSMIVNPELEAAVECSRILNFAQALKIDYFAKGKVDMVEVKLPVDCPLIGESLSSIRKKLGFKVLICAVQRNGEVYIPTGTFVLEEGDRIHVTGSHRNIVDFFKKIRLESKKIKNVMIAGGGRIAYYLAKRLLEDGINVKIIENNWERCKELSVLLSGAQIIYGDGTDQSVLIEEGIEYNDAFVSLTGIDEENIITSMYASKLNLKKVITKVNRMSLFPMLSSIGVDTVVSPKQLTANLIVQYVRSMSSKKSSRVETLYKLVNNLVEAIEFSVKKSNRVTNIPLKNLKLKDNILVACIIRGKEIIVPSGEDKIQVGDNVIIVTTNTMFDDLNEIIR